MKAIYFKNYILLLTLALFVILPSCEEKNGESIKAPSLTTVTTILDQKTSISGGNMGDWIAVHGQNLASTYAISFNDVEVDMEEIYYENEILYLQVPIKIPNNVTNKLTITTKGGEASYSFTVAVPDLELTGMFNEYTRPGDTIKIYGRFIDLYEIDSENTVIAFGEVQSPVIENGSTYITARVPGNAQANVKVKAINSKFGAVATCPGYYQDKNNIITTFDDDFPYTGPINNPNGLWVRIVELEHLKLSGNCLAFEINPENCPDGLGWWYLMEHSVPFTQDMISNPENYEFKFELNMGGPIRRTEFYIYYYWNSPPNVFGGEHFNVQDFWVWQTVTIPLSQIIEGNSGTVVSLNFRVQSFAPVEPVSMYFDNLRIYKKGD